MFTAANARGTVARGSRSIGRRVLVRQRRIPFAAASGSPSPPHILFLAPDVSVPTGGVQVMYRHVDILNESGIQAAVLHQKRGFRCHWFENQTRVTDFSRRRVTPDDILVVPELDVNRLAAMPVRIRHIILNQSGHLTWTRSFPIVEEYYSDASGLYGIICVSEHSQRLLEVLFPHLPVRRVSLSVDPRVFSPPGSLKPLRISYMPRRGVQDRVQVMQLLKARGVLQGWTVVPLDGLSRYGIAEEMRRSQIFLNFTYQEGFGLPPVEAMASGNYVVGFHGFGGREFFNPDFCSPVETGDVLGFAHEVERVIRAQAKDPAWCQTRGAKASDYVVSNYSPERERVSVLSAYSDLIGRDLQRFARD